MSTFSSLAHRARGIAAAAALALLAGATGSAFFTAQPAQALFPEAGFSEIAKAALPAYVNIGTRTQVAVGNRGGGGGGGGSGGPFDEFFRDFFDDLPNNPGTQMQRSEGSGFIVDPSGIVVTNNHVVDAADEVVVILQDGTILPATVIGVDDRIDIAVLRVEADHPLPFLDWGDSDTAEVGDWTLAIGNPFGLGGTLTAGIISARSRNINAGPYDDFIQTDASINRGNSGGPLLDLNGQVIGINTAIFSPTGASVGIGFAIPSNLARPVVAEIIEYGHPRRGWIGARLQNVSNDIASSLGMERPRGALIAGLSPDGPAGSSGLEAGDVVLSFNGTAIDEMRSLVRAVGDTEPGTLATVEIWRDGRLMNLEVKVGELTDVAVAALQQSATPNAEAALGLSLTSITPEVRERYGLGADAQGVLITGVQARTEAAARGLEPGDIITRVGQQAVTSPEEVLALVSEAKRNSRSSLTLGLTGRDGSQRIVPLGLEQG